MANKRQTIDVKDLQDTVPNKPKSNPKTQKVRVKEMIRADFGAFDEGDFAELPAQLAKELMIAGVVEFVSDIPAAKTEEDFI